jgi:dGTPase
VVDRLERRSPDYPGLNLSREVRESLLKHETSADWPAEFRPRPKHPYLEAQVVDLADSTAYAVHDLEDGLVAGMFDEAQVEAESALWRGARQAVELRHPGFLEATADRKLRIKRITNELLKICINDLIEASAASLAQARPESAEAVRAHAQLLIGHSRALADEVAELTRFLYARFYRHEHLLELSEHASRVLRDLFSVYVERPGEMRPWYQQWVREVGRERAACDYLAGMTDRFAEQEHARLRG